MSGGEGTGRQLGWSDARESGYGVESDPVQELLRLLTLLANCGLSAGAPPVLQPQRQN